MEVINMLHAHCPKRCVTTRSATKSTNAARVSTTTKATNANTDTSDTLPIAFTNETEKGANNVRVTDFTIAMTTKGLRHMPQLQAHNHWQLATEAATEAGN
jgi:hypothetical protein